MTGGEIWAKASRLEQFVETDAKRANGGLYKFGAAQGLGLGFPFIIAEDGDGEDDIGERRLPIGCKQGVHTAVGFADGWEIERQFFAHFHILRPLSREERHDAPFAGDAGLAVEDAFGMLPMVGRIAFEQVNGRFQKFNRLFPGIRHKTEPG